MSQSISTNIVKPSDIKNDFIKKRIEKCIGVSKINLNIERNFNDFSWFNTKDNTIYFYDIFNRNDNILHFNTFICKGIIVSQFNYNINNYLINIFIENIDNIYYTHLFILPIKKPSRRSAIFCEPDNFIHKQFEINILSTDKIDWNTLYFCPIDIYETDKYTFLLQKSLTINNDQQIINIEKCHIYNKTFDDIIVINNDIIDSYDDILILDDNTYFDISNKRIFDKGNFIGFIDSNKILETSNDSFVIKKIETNNPYYT